MASNLTRNGVCYDVENSPFWEEVGGFRFYFSSETHRKNFFAKAKVKELWLTDSLTRRFHFEVDASVLALFQLYWQIETRGFYIVSECGCEYRSLEDVKMKVGF